MKSQFPWWVNLVVASLVALPGCPLAGCSMNRLDSEQHQNQPAPEPAPTPSPSLLPTLALIGAAVAVAPTIYRLVRNTAREISAASYNGTPRGPATP